MNRLRVACLLLSAGYAGVLLLVWLAVVPAALLNPAPPGDTLGRGAMAALSLFYVAAGVVAVWWPLAAIERPGPHAALRCAAVALLHLGLVLAAAWPDDGAFLPSASWRALAEIGGVPLVGGFVFVFLSFGLIDGPMPPVLAYTALLLAGAALSRRRRPEVEGPEPHGSAAPGGSG